MMRRLGLSILSVMLTLVFCSSSLGVTPINQGPYNVPDIAPITLDGSLADWGDASPTLTYGAWYDLGVGLASTTTAQYAWNDTNDKLYVGVTTTEGAGAILEIGGLSTDGTKASTDGDGATQFEFQFDGAGAIASIVNQIGTAEDNVAAVSVLSGGTLVVEVAITLRTDYNAGTGDINLVNGMTIWEYSDIFDAGWVGGDHQNFDGEYFYSSGSQLDTFATQLYLVPEPATLGVLLVVGGLGLVRRRRN